SLKGWVPRFRTWDRDRLVSPGMEVTPPVSERFSEVVVFNDGHGMLRVGAPDCQLRGRYLSQHWAADIQALGATDDETTFRFPWLHPECDKLANRKIGHGHAPYSSRVSRHGIVTFKRGDRESVWI